MNSVVHPTDETLQALARAGDSGTRFEEVRRHLESCPDCAERWALMCEVWGVLGEAASPRDPEALWSGIERAMRHEPSERATVLRVDSSVSGSHKRWALAAMLVIGLGLGGLWWTQSGGPTDPASMNSGSGPAAGSSVGSAQLGSLDALSAPGASARMAAVGALEPLVDRPEVSDALVALLRSDPDEHVRLFALDALRPAFENGALPLEVLLAALATEESPLVQTDLIVLIRRVTGPDETDLRSLIDGGRLHPFVAAQLVSL